MAIDFTDGFDHLAAPDLLKKWTGLTSGTALTACTSGPQYGRPPGGMGLWVNDTNAGHGIYRVLPGTRASFVCGFNVLFTSTPGTSTFFATYDSSSGQPANTVQLGLRSDGAGHLLIGTGSAAGTNLATSTNVFSAGVWYHIELKATINNSTGAYEVRVNGTSAGWVPSATGKNTRGQSANNYIDVVSLQGGNTSGGIYYDDFYALNSTSPNNDFLGPQKILTAFPAGAGNYAQWTGNFASNYLNVNELGADGDATFNQSASAGTIDSFAFDDVPAGTITGIVHNLEVRQDTGAARTVAPLQRSGATDYPGTTLSVAGSYQILQDPHDVDPATSAAYTVSNFNAAEFGYKLIS